MIVNCDYFIGILIILIVDDDAIRIEVIENGIIFLGIVFLAFGIYNILFYYFFFQKKIFGFAYFYLFQNVKNKFLL